VEWTSVLVVVVVLHAVVVTGYLWKFSSCFCLRCLQKCLPIGVGNCHIVWIGLPIVSFLHVFKGTGLRTVVTTSV
jgi:hypothetical protein